MALFFYLNFVFQKTSDEAPVLSKFDMPMQAVLGFFSIYFLKNESYQMYTDGLAYFTSVWNYLDVITPTIILTIIFTNVCDFITLTANAQRILQAIGVFFMWLKLLYFFRIFRSYGYLIRLIVVVIEDMIIFLNVFLFTIIMFSDTLLTIAAGNEGRYYDDGSAVEPFVTSTIGSIIYTYRITLGDFDVDEFGVCLTFMVYTLFLACTVFNTIMMLNLLIAIISESFTNVKENAKNATY